MYIPNPGLTSWAIFGRPYGTFLSLLSGECFEPVAYRRLPFALASGSFLGLLLVGTPGSGARGLGRGFLARGALYFFPFQLVFDVLGIGHSFP